MKQYLILLFTVDTFWHWLARTKWQPCILLTFHKYDTQPWCCTNKLVVKCPVPVSMGTAMLFDTIVLKMNANIKHTQCFRFRSDSMVTHYTPVCPQRLWEQKYSRTLCCLTNNTLRNSVLWSPVNIQHTLYNALPIPTENKHKHFSQILRADFTHRLLNLSQKSVKHKGISQHLPL